MTAIATGVFKALIAKKQSALGTKAPASGPFGQSFRRVTSTIDLHKASYQSSEIRPSMQRSDMRHGIRSVEGAISGELSVGTYQDFLGSVLRKVWAATTPSTGIAITVGGTAGAYTLTRATGWITEGYKLGDVIRLSVGSLHADNINKNLLILGLTATVATVTTLNGSTMQTEGPIAGCTITAVGKKCWLPSSGHTRDYWTIEHFFSDIAQSEQFVDCVFGDANIKLPASGMATIDFPVKGLNMDTSTSTYFGTPLAASSGAVLAAVNGAVYVGGTAVGYITSFDVSIKGNMSNVGGVVGSNVDPDIFPGVVDVSGNATVLFTNATMRDYFINETEVSIMAVFTAANTAAADFMSVILPRVKFQGVAKDDGEKGLSMTMPFTALENTAGGSGVNTTATAIVIQDSAAV